MGAAPSETTVHASCIALDGKAVLIRGASGSGKSGLGLELMALGANLLADDRVILTRVGNAIIASCPPALNGMIEARGIGILNATPCPPCPVVLIVDLDKPEQERLPPRRSENLLGCRLPLLHNAGINHFAAAILQYLKAGRHDTG